MVDRGARVEGLWVFPSATDPQSYYYVPATARLVDDEGGRPRFSFLRYVINRPGEEESSGGTAQADGGGVLHFLVTYDTPPEELRRAERALKRLPGNEEAVLRGPVIFKSGRYALVSSIVSPAGQAEPQLLATGNAPVLEGSQLALAFELPPERATLLLASLQSATPDVSLVFEMTLEGFAEGFDADLVVHWDEVYKSEAWGVGGEMPLGLAVAGAGAALSGAGIAAAAATSGAAAPLIAAGVPLMAAGALLPGVGGEGSGVFEELRQSKAIELRTRGESAEMQAILDKAYAKLLDLLMEPVPAEAPPEQQPQGIAGMLAGAAKEDPSGRKPALIGVSAGYKLREERRTGTTVLSMSQQESVERTTTIAFNLGDLWKRVGDDPAHFKTVNLADAAFSQREIRVGIDGALVPEFDKFVNSVTATLRKRHQNGETTVQEVVIDRQTFNRTSNDFRMLYGWRGDHDREAWARYEYRTRWSFKSGGAFETDWHATDANLINLYAPYRRKLVRVVADRALLKEERIRALVVQVDYPFFGDMKRETFRLRPEAPPAGPEAIELTIPREAGEYHWVMTWYRQDGTRLSAEGSGDDAILLADPPEPELVTGADS
jgi:hypothetical protein